MNKNKTLMVGLMAVSTLSICSCVSTGGGSPIGGLINAFTESNGYCEMVKNGYIPDHSGVCEKLTSVQHMLYPNGSVLEENQNKPQDELWSTLIGGTGGAAIGCSIDTKTGCMVGTGVGLVLGNLVGKTAKEKREAYTEVNKELDIKIEATKNIIDDINKKIITLKETITSRGYNIKDLVRRARNNRNARTKARIELNKITSQLAESQLLKERVASGIILIDREITNVKQNRDKVGANFKADLDQKIVSLNEQRNDYNKKLDTLNEMNGTLVADQNQIESVVRS